MVLRFLATGLLFAAPVLAQVSSFPKPSYFRETFSSSLPKVELRPPVRLEDFVVNGKLELSLRSYLELVMANNTDVAIQRLSVETYRNQILRAFGPFDPVFTGNFSSQRQKTPTNSYLIGANTLVTLAQPASFAYSQRLDTGTTYQATFTGEKFSTNSGFQNYNPALTSNLGISFAQPLLRNRGRYVNRLPIMLARSRFRKSEYDLRTALFQLVSDAETAYWNVILARENLRVALSAQDLADQALKRAQLELKLGAMSPLDIYNPQQQYATAEIAVSQTRYALAQQEDLLRKQMGVDLDPVIRKLPIVLTESVMPTTEAAPMDAEMEVQKAMNLRPELKSFVQALDADDLQIKIGKNAILPNLSLTGAYTTQGQGGTFYQRTNVFTESGTASQVTRVIPGTFGDSLGQMFGFGFPVYSFGLTLQLPIRNRAAAADLADAVLQKRTDTLNLRNTQQQVRLDILTAVNQVESSKAAVKLAQVAQDFSKKYLEAEQKKYELGTSTIFFVLQAQQALVNAESAVVQNSVQYRKNLLNLLRRTGELLDARNIQVQ